jgi:hypothetical protein
MVKLLLIASLVTSACRPGGSGESSARTESTLAKWVQIGTALILGDPIGAKLAHQVKLLG